MIFPGGSTREYTYDPLMRLKQLTANDPGGNVLFDYQYEYDRIGNIKKKIPEHGTYSYGYDDASRLTSGENFTLEDETYTYDNVGNRKTASGVTGDITHHPQCEQRIAILRERGIRL